MAKTTRGSAELCRAVYPTIRLTDLAAKTGITRQRLRALARGESEVTASEMGKLRDALDISLQAWTEDRDPPSSPLPAANDDDE